MKKPSSRFIHGQMFSVPLLGGGFSFGYFTFTDGLMKLVNIFDLLSNSADIPADIESFPHVVFDLPISGVEFELKDRDIERNGARWILASRVVSSPPIPTARFFLQGMRGRERVIDILEELPDRSATDADRSNLKRHGCDFPPTTTNTIEIALRRIDIDPDDFNPADFR